jgi:myo-inositol-1-phosphate synthase
MTDSNTSSNGASRYQSDKVRVAIIGVGNCASSLVQGVEYYKDADPDASVPGLMHVDLGGYHIRDIEFSAAFARARPEAWAWRTAGAKAHA